MTRRNREPPRPLIGRTEAIAGSFLIAGSILVLAAVLLLTGDGNGNAGNAVAPPAGDPTETPEPFVPANDVERAIEALARRSIEVLPAGKWPDLYDDFVSEFQDRCDPEEFAEAGRQTAISLGASLGLLGFRNLQSLTVTGDTARGIILGELRGQSEYQVEAAFAVENGAWKLAPAPGTDGCNAFNQLTG